LGFPSADIIFHIFRLQKVTRNVSKISIESLQIYLSFISIFRKFPGQNNYVQISILPLYLLYNACILCYVEKPFDSTCDNYFIVPMIKYRFSVKSLLFSRNFRTTLFRSASEVVMFKKLKDKTKEAAATAASNLTRSDSMNSLNSTNSGFSGK